jgi:hypothetical protein
MAIVAFPSYEYLKTQKKNPFDKILSLKFWFKIFECKKVFLKSPILWYSMSHVKWDDQYHIHNIIMHKMFKCPSFQL